MGTFGVRVNVAWLYFFYIFISLSLNDVQRITTSIIQISQTSRHYLKPFHHSESFSLQKRCRKDTFFNWRCKLDNTLYQKFLCIINFFTMEQINIAWLNNLGSVAEMTDELIHYRSMFSFYTSWKSQKTRGFLTCSGTIEREHWPEMGYLYCVKGRIWSQQTLSCFQY